MASGYFGARSKVLTAAKHSVEKGLQYAFIGRKQKKRQYRALWIQRINAAVREHGMSYSRFMHLLSKSNVELNRKVLADLAMNDAAAFKAIVNVVK